MNRKLLESLIQQNPVISRESYQLLIDNYKKYDASQKDIINSLINKIKKLEFKIGQLESYIEEIEDSPIEKDKLQLFNTICSQKERIKELKESNNILNFKVLGYERLFLESLYPEYMDNKELIKEIHNLIEKYIN